MQRVPEFAPSYGLHLKLTCCRTFKLKVHKPRRRQVAVTAQAMLLLRRCKPAGFWLLTALEST